MAQRTSIANPWGRWDAAGRRFGGRPAFDKVTQLARGVAKRGILHIAKALGVFALLRKLTGRGVRILCYHGVWLGRDNFGGDSMFMAAETFEARLDRIASLGYRVIPLDLAIRGLKGGAKLPPASLVITIDDGWYSTYTAMLPALHRHAMPATLYCDTAHLLSDEPVAHLMAQYFLVLAQAGGTKVLQSDLDIAIDRKRSMVDRLAATRAIADALGIDIEPYLDAKVFHYMSAQQLAGVAATGLDVQLHTHNHTLHDLSPTKIRREIEYNRAALSAILARPPEAFNHFCYPSGVASAEAAVALGDMELHSSTTTEQGIAWSESSLHLLPRILDGENVSMIEFESELSGFAEVMRAMRRRLQRAARRLGLRRYASL